MNQPRILDGKSVAASVLEECRAETAELKAKGITPGLAVVLVGDDPASAVYVGSKARTCADLGFHSVDFDNGLDDVDSAVDFLADDLLPNAFQWPHWDQILVGEGIPHLLGRHLATITTGTFGDLLDNSAELDLQTAGQD